MTSRQAGLLNLLEQHIAWYPLMEPRDIYKLLYQGAMGAEHLISSEEEFVQHLRQEYDRLQPDALIRLAERVKADGTLLRLNLRASKHRKLDFVSLVNALVKTAGSFPDNPLQLQADWDEFVGSCEAGSLPSFKLTEVHQFTLWLGRAGFPAVHHSEVYRREYQPAYRLVGAQFLSELGVNDAGRF